MKRLHDPIVIALQRPGSVLALDAAGWDLLVRQGRSTNLLAKLGNILSTCRLLDHVPKAPRQHLVSAMLMAQRQTEALQWEVTCIGAALAEVDARPALLKGAAYVMVGLKVACGRTFSDVDILVPKRALEHTEISLKIHGWQGGDYDEYDQRYYRRWMHEIPPMRHVRRSTTIDVHHSILPETARIKINTPALFDHLQALPDRDKLCVLPPVDMFLHSATHLFHEGEFEKGLRDLFDLDALLDELGAGTTFWEQLVPRAIELGLQRPLFYALRYTSHLLGTAVPDDVLVAARVGRPTAAVLMVADWCYGRALRPVHHSADTLGSHVARLALYVRSHWIRMPVPLLIYHLGRKAILSLMTDQDRKADDVPAQAAVPPKRT